MKLRLVVQCLRSFPCAGILTPLAAHALCSKRVKQSLQAPLFLTNIMQL